MGQLFKEDPDTFRQNMNKIYTFAPKIRNCLTIMYDQAPYSDSSSDDSESELNIDKTY